MTDESSAPGFLEGLPLSDEERGKLRSFGAKTPLGLLEMRKASPEAFDAYVGPDRADAIASELTKLLSDGDRAVLNQPAKPAGRLGARLDARPKQ